MPQIHLWYEIIIKLNLFSFLDDGNPEPSHSWFRSQEQGLICREWGKALRKRLQLWQSNTGGLGSRAGHLQIIEIFFPSKRPLNHYKMKLSMRNLKYLQGDCWRICRLIQLGEVRSSSLQEQTDLPRFPEIWRSPESFEKANLSSAVTDFREKSSWDARM